MPTCTRRTRRPARTHAPLMLLLAIAAAWLTCGTRATPPAYAHSEPAPTRTQILVALARAGCDPETLAAAGLTVPEITPLIEGVRAALAQDPAQLRRVDSDVAAKRRLVEIARKLPESDPTRSAQLAQSESALMQASEARDLALSSLRAAAFSQASTEVAARHTRVLRNRVWNLPTRFLVKDRAECEWVALRDALAKLSAEATPGAPVPAALIALVDTEERDPEILAAAQRLRPESLGPFRSAWDAAILALPSAP